jgi:Xaa-Pro dipeptidase
MWGVEGNKTVGISDTFLVTADGCESFFTLDRDFVLKPASGKAAGTRAGSAKPSAAAPARAAKTNGEDHHKDRNKDHRTDHRKNQGATHAESD